MTTVSHSRPVSLFDALIVFASRMNDECIPYSVVVILSFSFTSKWRMIDTSHWDFMFFLSALNRNNY